VTAPFAWLVRRNENLLAQERSPPALGGNKKIEPLSLYDGPFSLG